MLHGLLPMRQYKHTVKGIKQSKEKKNNNNNADYNATDKMNKHKIHNTKNKSIHINIQHQMDFLSHFYIDKHVRIFFMRHHNNTHIDMNQEGFFS